MWIRKDNELQRLQNFVKSSGVCDRKMEAGTAFFRILQKDGDGISSKNDRMFHKVERKQQKHTVYDHCGIRISKDIEPDGAWDISADQNRTIWAWTENAENKMLLLKIGSEDGIYANASCAHLFEGYCNTIKIVFHDLFDTSQVTDMSYMVANCEKLKEVDVDSFDTDKVTNMYAMFSNCKKIERVDVSRFNTSNVTNMGLMFAICAKLEKLNISNFDTRKVTSMKTMFCGCSELKELDVHGFDTRLVTDMSSMFLGCKNLRNLDISNFHFQKEAKTSNMFRYSGMDGIAVGK